MAKRLSVCPHLLAAARERANVSHSLSCCARLVNGGAGRHAGCIASQVDLSSRAHPSKTRSAGTAAHQRTGNADHAGWPDGDASRRLYFRTAFGRLPRRTDAPNGTALAEHSFYRAWRRTSSGFSAGDPEQPGGSGGMKGIHRKVGKLEDRK